MGATVPTTADATDRREPEPRFTGESRSTRERNTPSAKPAEDPGSRRGGTPELGEEMSDEHQALLAAHKADRSFVTVEEWTAKADRRKGVTVLGKDPVVRH